MGRQPPHSSPGRARQWRPLGPKLILRIFPARISCSRPPALLNLNPASQSFRAAGRLAAGLRHNAEAQQTRIARGRDRIGVLMERAARAVLTLIDHRAARIERAGQLLAALSYQGVLARGFALVRGPESHPLRAAAAVVAGMRLDIEFHDGHVDAVAGNRGEVKPPADTARPKPKRRPGGEGQGSLFGA